MQKFLQNLFNRIFNQEKLKMCKFPLTGFLQKICNFFRKRFSLLQAKAVIQAVCLRTQAVSIKVRF